jgi:ubiquinone/menaquinone biosynthesis C-methylase UbiE
MPGNSNCAVREGSVVDSDNVQKYYDNTDTDEFYSRIWGGEDLHLAFYDKPLEEQDIRETSTRAVHWLSRLLFNKGALQPGFLGIDLGAGYGGSARYLSSTYGVQIDCVNISEWQNRRNTEITEAAGLSEFVKVYLGSFTDLPCESNRYDFAWCEEALIHSPDKLKVFQEAHRVLKSGGLFLLTDPLQKEISHEELVPILERAHLVDMGSRDRYRKYASNCGFELLEEIDCPQALIDTYGRVKMELEKQGKQLAKEGLCSIAFQEKMKAGLQRWVDAGQQGKLTWTVFLFQKK